VNQAKVAVALTGITLFFVALIATPIYLLWDTKPTTVKFYPYQCASISTGRERDRQYAYKPPGQPYRIQTVHEFESARTCQTYEWHQ
jgi:hypothetical protein